MKAKKVIKNLPELTVHQHILELRSRLLFYTLCFLLASIVGYFLQDKITAFLIRPWHQTLYYNNVTGGLEFVLKSSFFFGFLVSLPVLIYQLIRFIEPAIAAESRFSIVRFLLGSLFLMITGMTVSYTLIVPATIRFLSSFTSKTIQPLLSVDAYFNFIFWYIAGFALLFQLPIAILIICRVTPLTYKDFLKWQKYVVVACFIVAAILTPTPDFFNQTLFALPLILLYYFSIILVWLSSRFKVRIT